MASIQVMQPSPCSSDCSWLNIGSDTEGLAIIGISIMQSIHNAASCMMRPICKSRWIKHCFNMGFSSMEAISDSQCKVLCVGSPSELWQCHFIRQSKHNVKIQETKLNVKT